MLLLAICYTSTTLFTAIGGARMTLVVRTPFSFPAAILLAMASVSNPLQINVGDACEDAAADGARMAGLYSCRRALCRTIGWRATERNLVVIGRRAVRLGDR
jgi:hypothetical protein